MPRNESITESDIASQIHFASGGGGAAGEEEGSDASGDPAAAKKENASETERPGGEAGAKPSPEAAPRAGEKEKSQPKRPRQPEEDASLGGPPNGSSGEGGGQKEAPRGRSGPEASRPDRAAAEPAPSDMVARAKEAQKKAPPHYEGNRVTFFLTDRQLRVFKKKAALWGSNSAYIISALGLEEEE